MSKNSKLEQYNSNGKIFLDKTSGSEGRIGGASPQESMDHLYGSFTGLMYYVCIKNDEYFDVTLYSIMERNGCDAVCLQHNYQTCSFSPNDCIWDLDPNKFGKEKV